MALCDGAEVGISIGEVGMTSAIVEWLGVASDDVKEAGSFDTKEGVVSTSEKNDVLELWAPLVAVYTDTSIEGKGAFTVE